MSKMIDLITLGVIEKIFDGINVKSMSKSLYINCMIKHFKTKIALFENSASFELPLNEIKNFQKWEQNFIDLKNNGLVEISVSSIVFLNKWGQHIDSFKYAGIKKGNNQLSSALVFEEDLKKNQSMIEVIAMKNKLAKNQIINLIRIFVLEQDATETLYKDLGECSKHFIYWVNTNKDNIDMSIETVKSNGKILGL
jgi:hypothetical protein